MDAKAEAPCICVVCVQLAEADRRYIRRLQADRQMRRALTDALVVSMGFCHRHWQELRKVDRDTAALSERCVSDATARLAELFARTRLQDEFLQDLLFGARSRCPACLFSRRLEGRLLSRMMHDLESKETSLRKLFSDDLCFEHARQLSGRPEGSLRARLKAALRKKGSHILASAALVDITDESRAIEQMLVANIYPYANIPASPGLTMTVTTDTCDPDSCPVCAELEESRKRWLQSVAENIRLGQPTWLTLPTCADHVVTCLHSERASYAISVAQRYVEASLASTARRQITGPGRKHRRRSHRWFNASTEKHEAAVDAQVIDPELLGDPTKLAYCPGCQQIDVAMRRAVFSFLQVVARASASQAQILLGRLCLKHVAEVLIYASDEPTQTRLVACLNKAYRRASDVDTTPALVDDRPAMSGTGFDARA
jgi:hypothetical protein